MDTYIYSTHVLPPVRKYIVTYQTLVFKCSSLQTKIGTYKMFFKLRKQTSRGYTVVRFTSLTSIIGLRHKIWNNMDDHAQHEIGHDK